MRRLHPLDLLLDDRALVELCRHVVCRGADQLHTTLVGLVIRLGSLESRQEGMMDVDRLAVEVAAAIGGEDLHVASERQQLGIHALKELDQPLLLLCFATIDDRQVVVWHAMPFGKTPHVLMIRHHRHHLDG